MEDPRVLNAQKLYEEAMATKDDKEMEGAKKALDAAIYARDRTSKGKGLRRKESGLLESRAMYCALCSYLRNGLPTRGPKVSNVKSQLLYFVKSVDSPLTLLKDILPQSLDNLFRDYKEPAYAWSGSTPEKLADLKEAFQECTRAAAPV